MAGSTPADHGSHCGRTTRNRLLRTCRGSGTAANPGIKIQRNPADIPRVSTNEPFPSHPAGPPVNQFGTPTGQFGAPVNQFGTPPTLSGGTPLQFGTPYRARHSRPRSATRALPAAGWGSPPAPPKRGLTRSRRWSRAALGVALLVGGGLALRYYVFPDLSKPIELPAVAAGLAAERDRGATTASRSRRRTTERRTPRRWPSTPDDQTRPTDRGRWSWPAAAWSTAQRATVDLAASIPVSKVGKLTCTAETGLRRRSVGTPPLRPRGVAASVERAEPPARSAGGRAVTSR